MRYVSVTRDDLRPEDQLEVGDEVRGNFRCAECDLYITSPKESDGILVLPVCSLCGSTEWRRVS